MSQPLDPQCPGFREIVVNPPNDVSGRAWGFGPTRTDRRRTEASEEGTIGAWVF